MLKLYKMKLTNDQLNTIALNMIHYSNNRAMIKLGKAILKSSMEQIRYLYSVFKFDFIANM